MNLVDKLHYFISQSQSGREKHLDVGTVMKSTFTNTIKTIKLHKYNLFRVK